MSNQDVPTRQEMFNLAYLGLKSQDWQRCESGGGCVYDDGKGHHCAWGWVDPELWIAYAGGPVTVNGKVVTLHAKVVGLAARLTEQDLIFAQLLQDAHDEAYDSIHMKRNFVRLAVNYSLTIPE